MDLTYREQVTPFGASVVRSDGAIVPADPGNTDWQAYQAWLKAGHAPAPAPAAMRTAKV